MSTAYTIGLIALTRSGGTACGICPKILVRFLRKRRFSHKFLSSLKNVTFKKKYEVVRNVYQSELNLQKIAF